jgi:hypothetical protein
MNTQEKSIEKWFAISGPPVRMRLEKLITTDYTGTYQTKTVIVEQYDQQTGVGGTVVIRASGDTWEQAIDNLNNEKPYPDLTAE